MSSTAFSGSIKSCLGCSVRTKGAFSSSCSSCAAAAAAASSSACLAASSSACLAASSSACLAASSSCFCFSASSIAACFSASALSTFVFSCTSIALSTVLNPSFSSGSGTSGISVNGAFSLTSPRLPSDASTRCLRLLVDKPFCRSAKTKHAKISLSFIIFIYKPFALN